MKHKELTQAIIGGAIAVLKELKPGLDEKLYENFSPCLRVLRGNPPPPRSVGWCGCFFCAIPFSDPVGLPM